jgi:Xaa-Pro dipeptidase
MLNRLRDIVTRNGLNVVLASSPDNIYYVSRFRALEPYKSMICAIMPADGDPVLLLSERDENFLGESSIRKELYSAKTNWELYSDYSDGCEAFVSAVQRILRELGSHKGSVGFDEKYLPSMLADELRKALPSANLKHASSIFEEARRVKSEFEIDKLRSAARVGENALVEAYAETREGQSELEFATALRTSIVRRGGDTSFIEMSVGPHRPSHPSERKIRRGQLVHVDLGVTSHGYSSDFCRNAVLMEETEEQVRINEIQKESHREVFPILCPGTKICDIFYTATNAIRARGVNNYKRLHVGHGVGISPHEPPLISPTNQTRLEAGMTLCLEMPYYAPGIGSFNIENVVAIRERGCEIISNLSEDLFVIPERGRYRQ